MRCVQMLPVVKDFLAPNGEWVLDFGQNITGVVHAKLDLPAGAQVRLRHAESLDENGNFYTGNLSFAKSEDTFRSAGQPAEYLPRFTCHGFRYLCVEGLPGQAGGEAAAALLTGTANPGGKLTGTWPLSYDQVPSRDTFGQKVTRYKEGLYVGYRYYDTAGVPVRYPFGYGLSYTRFAYSDLTVENRTVRVAVTNIGDCPGAEVAQLYIAPPRTGPYRPAKELKGFARVYLTPGESRTVDFPLDDRSFAIWSDGRKVPAGTYTLLVGSSSADIRLQQEIEMPGADLPPPPGRPAAGMNLAGPAPDDEFAALYGSPLQDDPPLEPGRFSMEDSIMEMKDFSPLMMQAFRGTEATIAQGFGGKADYSNPDFRMMIMSGADAPLRAAVLSSGGSFPAAAAQGLLAAANGQTDGPA